MMDPKLFDFAATLKFETQENNESGGAYLVNDGTKDHWLPKRFTENNGDGTFTIPIWMAEEKGII